MRLIADASSLVAELLRERGRELVRHPNLELGAPEPVWAETLHELNRRVDLIIRQGRLPVDQARMLHTAAAETMESRVELLSATTYAHLEPLARRRIPRDPNDWPTVAAAIALDAPIWTNDYDFFGCGVATWTTETPIAHLRFAGDT